MMNLHQGLRIASEGVRRDISCAAIQTDIIQGFDVHIYYFQNNQGQVDFAKALWKRIRYEFPELRIYKLWDKPIGPHTVRPFLMFVSSTLTSSPVPMFEVNLHTPAQFGAFIPWLVM